MDTDAMVGILFDHLAQNNMLDNTTVLLFSDHNAYYHDLSWTIKGTDVADNSSTITHGVPLMIYSSKLAGQNIANFCNTYDIYPTICNAFGFEYSTAFALGVDMLSADIENSMFMSFLTGFYSQTCYSKNASIYKLYNGATAADLDYFKRRICKFYDKQIKLDKIYYRGWTV
jgi:arylsulfatase A-like enzyme